MKKLMRMRVFCAIISLFGICIQPAYASLVFDIGYAFNYSALPTNPGPWVTATFTDTATPGEVQLTITAPNLEIYEKVGEVFFNLDPALDPADLVFSNFSTDAGQVIAPDVLHTPMKSNDYKADGDGIYDIEFDFSNDGEDEAFNGGDSITYTITITNGTLSASSFDFLSDPGSGSAVGPFNTVVHILSPDNQSSLSTWITVPEPATLALLGLGGLLLRRKNKI